MEFIKEEDLQLIASCANQDVNDNDFKKLKFIYQKLEHICILLQAKGFDYQIRKDPRKQAGQGLFKFQEYHWAKVYPKEYKQVAQDKFAYIIGFTDVLHFHLMGIKDYQELPGSKEASKTCWTELDIDDSTYEKIVEEFVLFDKKYRNLFIKTGAALGIEQFKNIVIEMKNTEIKQLIEYKKQIILQGPPGTGKTRKAKEIARELLLPKEITVDEIKTTIKKGMIIYSATDKIKYTVESVSATSVTLQLESNSKQTPSFQKIIEAYKNKKWDGGMTGGDAYETAIAKHIYDSILPEKQFKLIQFHPSYSYEDFVRGIVANPNEGGDGILYEAENKLLGLFASDALDNYRKSKLNTAELSKEKWIDEKWSAYVLEIEKETAKNGIYKLTDKVSIREVEDDCFKYKGDDWKYTSRINFKDCKQLLKHFIENESFKIEFNKLISRHAYYRQSYYAPILENFNNIEENKYPGDSSVREELKDYILVIDEINRANLSSVLGELIYALEYRGEAVESMYAVEGDKKLTLPPNLYIIGTMNTADRSVGHIDYAIRRRFAFVDVFPTNEPITIGKEKFEKVSSLFIKNYATIDWSSPKPERSEHLAADFRPEDVWIGHSYFITKDKDENGNPINEQEQLNIKMKYEVAPILKEYVKDGILLESDNVKEVIASLC